MTIITVYQDRGQTYPVPMSGLGDVAETIEDKYVTLRNKCLEQYGSDFCNAVLPRRLIYTVTRPGEGYAPSVPWWGWMLAGYMVSRILR